MEDSTEPREAKDGPEASVLVPAVHGWPFGPAFFVNHLGAFLRAQCPEPCDGLPLVHLHLATGDLLDVCHVVGLAASWVALAVDEGSGASGARRMRTELVPYATIVRVTIRARQSSDKTLGFDQSDRPIPRLASPEDMLESAAMPSKRLAAATESVAP